MNSRYLFFFVLVSALLHLAHGFYFSVVEEQFICDSLKYSPCRCSLCDQDRGTGDFCTCPHVECPSSKYDDYFNLFVLHSFCVVIVSWCWLICVLLVCSYWSQCNITEFGSTGGIEIRLNSLFVFFSFSFLFCLLVCPQLPLCVYR